MTHAWPLRVVVVLAICAVVVLTPVGRVARAATGHEGETALAAMVAAEEDLLADAEAARGANLRAQQTAATALAKAAGTLAGAQDAVAKLPASADSDAARTVAVALQQALVNAKVGHADAREALERLLVESSRLEAVADDRRARVDALREALGRVRRKLPPLGELEGEWTATFSPKPEVLTLVLTQEGPFVFGTLRGKAGDVGNVSGQFVAGHVHLERFDDHAAKVADVTCILASNGELQGTWQSTIFGTGQADSGPFLARRQP